MWALSTSPLLFCNKFCYMLYTFCYMLDSICYMPFAIYAIYAFQVMTSCNALLCSVFFSAACCTVQLFTPVSLIQWSSDTVIQWYTWYSDAWCISDGEVGRQMGFTSCIGQRDAPITCNLFWTQKHKTHKQYVCCSSCGMWRGGWEDSAVTLSSVKCEMWNV